MKQLFIVWISLLFVGNAPAQSVQFSHYTVNEGLASSVVYYAMQDSKGFVWFCTESGINRFDGHTFEVFTIKDGLADNENFRCMEDSRGYIWFASYNGKLSYFNGHTFINEKQNPGLAYKTEINRHIMDMIEDDDGNIWFSRYLDEVNYKYDGKKVSEVRGVIFDQLRPNKLYFNYNKTINYFRFDQTGFYRENLSKQIGTVVLREIKKIESITNACLQVSAVNQFYFNTNAGFHHFRNDSIFTDITNENLGLSTRQGMLTFKIIGNNLWIGTANKGLFLIPDFKTKGFTGKFSHFLNNITISCVTDDNEGGVWITTLSEGIYYIPVSGFYITNIAGESVTSIKHSDQGDMLAIGSYYGNLRIDSCGKTIRQFEFDSTVTTRLKGLKWLSKTKIFIGMDYTPYVYDLVTKKISYFINETQIGFSDMDEGAAGFWLEGRGLIILITNKKTEELYRQKTLFTEKLVSIAEGGSEGCWFTSIIDLYWLELATKKITKIAGRNVFNSNLRDLKYVNGYLWVATDGNGLFIFKDRKLIKHICSMNSTITSDVCQKLVYDGKQNIWVATNKGISVFDAYSYAYLRSITSDDILINNDIKDIDIQDKKAYVATPSGISIIDLDKLITEVGPPKIYIKRFFTDEKVYDDQSFPVFKYYNGVVKLVYTAITFQSRQSLLYRYKIKKEGNSWNETKSEQLEFYNLNPGVYTVLVSAKKYNSKWSVPVAFSFTVLPLWYQSTLFFVVTFLFLLLALWVIVYRIIKTNKQKNEIKRKVLESELKAIRLHMNPHFIFNTLNSLQLFIFQNKSLEANNYIAKFSKLIRWIMSYSDKQEITLKEELEFLRIYIELEQLRFKEAFTLILYVDETLNPESTFVPPLVIQPFVENAIKYGLSGKEEPGSLLLNFQEKNRFIFVTIEDNGVGRTQVKKEQGESQKKFESTGIKYTEERLKLLIKGVKVKMPVKITDLYDASGKATGTRVELIVPILL